MPITADSTTAPFTEPLGCLVEPALAALAVQLAGIPGLGRGERGAFRDGAGTALYETVHRKVARVLLLELNAARVTGRLTAATSKERWDEFIGLAGRPEFWDSLTGQYPTLLPRLRRVIGNRCAAALTMARRFSADRAALGALLGAEPGELTEVTFGAGDSHRGGHAVAILRCAAGRVVYKPRPVEIDVALAGLLDELLGDEPAATRIRVPPALARDGYGWAEHVEHRYCADDAELAAFYRGMGHWLAVMRLLGGSDLHAENMIACGPVPVVVDCETLFTPVPPSRPTGLGQAMDRARDLINGTVLRTGMLPGRGIGLGWRGIDPSAGGALPGQQPASMQPVIIDAGTDEARIGMEPFEVPRAANHPSPEPALARYWGSVLAGFDELTERLAGLDRAGRLAPMLDRFRDCPSRVVTRATEVYAEIGRMLWHPVSLHDEPAAVERATRLLAKMAEHVHSAPGDPDVIAAEVAELLDGDVPFFGAIPGRGRLDGPRGTTWLPELDLVDDALRRWREADLGLERSVIQAALVSAYLNDGWLPDEEPMRVTSPPTDQLDERRRALAAMIVRQLPRHAIRADDGTVSWIAPVLNPTGWAVQMLSPDLYAGLGGVALLLAAYLREAAAGRADQVDGLESLLDDTLRTMRMAQDQREAQLRAGTAMRPPPPGGYVGLGSRIWTWLTLDRMGAAGPDGLARALGLARLVPEAIEADDGFDVLIGMAGAIVPLLALAERTGEQRWVDLASSIGERLVAGALVANGHARWPWSRWSEGLGGFSHGATGIGWALHRLALVTGDERCAAMGDAALAFEESLYDPSGPGWLDLRYDVVSAAAWCHGGVGIGLAAADLLRHGADGPHLDVVRRAAEAAWATGRGWSHTLCHGDLGCWEMMEVALGLGVAPAGLDRQALDAQVIGSMEEHGPVSGLARHAFSPGLLAGLGGMAYQLLRMHPESGLPSVLTLGGGPA